MLTLALKAASATKAMFSVAAVAYSVKTAGASITVSITHLITLSGQAPADKKANVPSAATVGLLGRSPVSTSPVRRVRCVRLRWACWVATPGGRECVQSPRTQ